ncbi:hypothetical protein ACSAGD_00645 [Paramicrobacterium sp. CJ85]
MSNDRLLARSATSLIVTATITGVVAVTAAAAALWLITIGL